jgi:hypothetical protein
MRLTPLAPEWYIEMLGYAYYFAGQYENAVSTLRSITTYQTVYIELYTAASYVGLSSLSEARAAVQQALALDPQASVERWFSSYMEPILDDAVAERVRTALEMAGLPLD